MKLQFTNQVVSSFLMTIDNAILSSGEAFKNATGLFYPVTGMISGMYAYTTPYRQLVNDASISGANILSGVYVSGVFIKPGQSGLISLNVSEGTAYFSYRPSAVSGIFAIKDINVYLTTYPEEQLLMETKFLLKPKYPQTITGLPVTAQTYPVVYLKKLSSENVPFCLGGAYDKNIQLRAVVLGESEYQTLAVCDILENLSQTKQPILNVTGLPFDAIGGFKTVSYNYETAKSGVINSYVAKAQSSHLMNIRQYNTLNPDVFPAFVDFELWNSFFP